jgi:hypothetical protein
MSTVIVCRPPNFPIRRITNCPTCKQRRRFAGFDGGPYYGPTLTCCGCGDTWTCGEMQDRPFKRAWRREAIAQAKRAWDRAGQFTRAEYEAWTAAELEAVMRTPCGPTPDQCNAESGEPCAGHEREQAHADGEHELCDHDGEAQR